MPRLSRRRRHLRFIMALRRRQEPAWRSLCERLGVYVRSTLRLYGIRPADLADCEQNVWLKALRYVGTLRVDAIRSGRHTARSLLKAWLRSIARSSAMDEHRRRKHRPLIDSAAVERCVAPALVTPASLLFADLDDEERRLILLRLAGCSYPQLARVVGLSVGTLHGKIQRIGKRLVLGV